MAMERRHVEVLNTCDHDLMMTLNLPFLLPHLKECKLLAEKEVASLSKPGLNPPEVNRHFLNILKSKGSRAFSLFLNALKKEDEHIGHRELYELLYQENQCTPDRPDNCLQESNESESYPTALVVPNTGNNNLEIGVAKPWVSTGTQSQKSSASDVSSTFTSSNEAFSLISMQQQLGSIENHIVEVKNILTSSSSDISSASDEHSRRTSVSGCKDGKEIVKPLRKSETYPMFNMKNQRSRHPSLQHTYSALTPNTGNKVKTTESIVIESNLFYLPPVFKEGELHLILYQTEQQRMRETVCSFDLESKRWRNREVITTSNSNQRAFSLLYGGELAILRAVSIDDRAASAKVNICKLKQPSSWELIPFTSESVTPVNLKNCQCVQSTRQIVLVSVCQSAINIHMHHYSSQWSKVSFSLPSSTTSYQLQSCLIAHQLTLYCSLLCQEASSQSRVIVYKLKLEQPNVAKNTTELVHSCSSDVLQCYLFTSYGKATAAKIIENKHSSSCFLEFCPLNDAATSNFFRKEYSFIIKLISVVPLHSAAYNNHVLIVYYDSRSEKSYLEVFSLV